jgi:CheY-like chemotaxis protein/HPt (histidine-containing phosphotransfer) domain-containing protein
MVPTATRSGPDAIQWVRDASTTTQPYNVILLDANMPELDGFTVAQQITADVVSLPPIIVLTSSSAQGDSVRCRQLGISGSLTKPIRPRALYDLVSAAVARGQSDTKPTPDDLGPTVRKFRVLVAEDNVINQKAVTSLLVPRGHVVDVVANGADAVRAVQRQEYDLVLMDVQMPEMSGMEATRTIRTLEANTARHTRIVAVTAHAMKGDREECLAAGMDGYLAKPIDKKALLAVVEQAVPFGVAIDSRSRFDVEAMRSRLGHDEALVRELMQLFLDDNRGYCDKIARAIQEREAEMLRSHAHTLKGVAAQLSAATVTACATTLVQASAAAEVDWDFVQTSWSRLKREVMYFEFEVQSAQSAPTAVDPAPTAVDPAEGQSKPVAIGYRGACTY